MDVSSVQVFVICVIVCFVVKWNVRKRKYRLPPGPSFFTIIRVVFTHSSSAIVYLAFDWVKEYGSIFTLHFGPQLVVALNSVDVAYDALSKMDMAGRPFIASLQLLSGGGNNIGQSQVGPKWRLHRKLTVKALRMLLQGDAMDKKIHSAYKLTAQYLEKANGPIDPKIYCDLTIYNILSTFLINKSYTLEDSDFKKISKVNDDIIFDFGNCMFEDIFPGLRHIYPSKQYRKTDEHIRYLQQFFGWEQLKSHKENYNKDKLVDFLDVLLKAQRDAEASGDPEELKLITDLYIVMDIVDLFTAGTDTTRSTLNWMIKYLSLYPEKQDRLREEIEHVVGRGRLPQVSDKSKLPYCESVMLETMRIRPSLPFALVHSAYCDTTIGEYDVPKGTLIGLNVWAIHHDPNHWNTPSEFQPERFLTEDGKLDPRPRSWLAFGTGTRVCLGKNTAKNELILVLACLIQNFRFRLPDHVKDMDMSPTGCAFVHCPRSYEVLVEKLS